MNIKAFSMTAQGASHIKKNKEPEIDYIKSTKIINSERQKLLEIQNIVI